METIQHDKSLKDYNTFGIDVTAKLFTSISTVDELRDIYRNYSTENKLILGGGSNVLLTKDFDGLVIKNEIRGISISEEDEDTVILKVGAGESWHQFVLYCIENEYAGVENLSLIPGSVGASPMQNIGAYGVEIKDVFHKLQALNVFTLDLHTYTKDACNFGYRESVFKKEFKNQYVICYVYYKLHKKAAVNTSYGAINERLRSQGIESPNIKDVSDAVIAIRSEKLPDPKVLGNAGSFFKNPVITRVLYDTLKEAYPAIPMYVIDATLVKVPAAWLIENAGWKGYDGGKYGVHTNQALVLVNKGGAKGAEIWDLSQRIVDDVNAKYGIALEREVNIY